MSKRKFDRMVKAKHVRPWNGAKALARAKDGFIVTFAGEIIPAKAVVYRDDVLARNTSGRPGMQIHPYAKFVTTKTAARRIAIRVLRRALRDRNILITTLERANERDRKALADLNATEKK